MSGTTTADDTSDPGHRASPPPIRYPLPTLLALILLAFLSWRGAALMRSLRSALAPRLAPWVAGPPVPHSDRPQVVSGPILRRALLLHDDVPVSARPGGPPSDTIRHRMFVDIYDVWPLKGEPTHFRVGNRRPIGWVRAVEIIPWDTRLVLRRPDGKLPLSGKPDRGASSSTHVGHSSLPVVAWTSDSLQVTVWASDRPWSEVDRLAWVPLSAIPSAGWGVWLSREELLALIRRTLAASGPSPSLRLRALLGRLLDDRPLTEADLHAARAALPPPALNLTAGSIEAASERLARANEQWSAEATWAGLSFQFIPLEALP